MRQSEGLVKKQKDELRNIQKEITPKLVKELYSFLETKNIPKVTTMIECLIGLLRNSEESRASDVKVYLQKYEGLIYKMQNVTFTRLRDSVLDKHLDTIKLITKSFVDSSTEDFKVCAPFAPFLAWASQFVIYCRYAQQLEKVQSQIRSLEKEFDEKYDKYFGVKYIVDALNKESYGAIFTKEVQEDEIRIFQYEQYQTALIERAKGEQQTYLNFEKKFF